MERERGKVLEKPTREVNLSDRRSQAIGLALAKEKNRKPNGKLEVKDYVRIVDEVRSTHPTFTDKDDRDISIAKSSTARNNVVAGLRKIITVLESTSPRKFPPEVRAHMERTFAQIKVIVGDPDLAPNDLYRIFSIEPAKKTRANAFSSKTSTLVYSPPPPPPASTEWFFDREDFWRNWRNSRPQFIGDPNATGTPHVPDDIED